MRNIDLRYRLTILLLGIITLPITFTLVCLWVMAWVFGRLILKDSLDISLKQFIYEFWTEAF